MIIQKNLTAACSVRMTHLLFMYSALEALLPMAFHTKLHPTTLEGQLQ